MRNALIEELARQRAADLARAADDARAARGGPDRRREGLISSVRALLVRRRRDAQAAGERPVPPVPTSGGTASVRPAWKQAGE
jgi:hypothetical protein